MRLFFSYARVDRTICEQIAAFLKPSNFDIWYDKRMLAGQHWWTEIRRQLDLCDAFVYLLSPDSVESKYCKKEYEIARRTGKVIIPVLVNADTVLPDELAEYHYADFSQGNTPEAVKTLLNALFAGDQVESPKRPDYSLEEVYGKEEEIEFDPDNLEQPRSPIDVELMVTEAAEAFYAREYDRAVFLLKQVQASGYQPRFVDLEAMLEEAEAALDRQANLRDAEREYLPIAMLVKEELTRIHGCRAFRLFRNDYPDYDPDNLEAICRQFDVSVDEWCLIPAGRVKMRREEKVKVFYLEEFEISKYPVTNAQMQEFIDAPDGYASEKWWDFSPFARDWRRSCPEAIQPMPGQLNYPCVNISWYEAVAYCRWLSYRTQSVIALPTEQQWQRAAQGDDGRRFPWGEQFDRSRCNTRESGTAMTVPVTQYPAGVSPYGVFDMVGNAWEWCVNSEFSGDERNTLEHEKRIIKGGSFIRSYRQAQCQRYFSLDPQTRHESIGFRVVRLGQ